MTREPKQIMLDRMAVQKQLDAMKTFFEAAALMANKKDTEYYRQQAHRLLDCELDASAELGEAMRGLAE